jgi:hypothetical protein
MREDYDGVVQALDHGADHNKKRKMENQENHHKKDPTHDISEADKVKLMESALKVLYGSIFQSLFGGLECPLPYLDKLKEPHHRLLEGFRSGASIILAASQFSQRQPHQLWSLISPHCEKSDKPANSCGELASQICVAVFLICHIFFRFNVPHQGPCQELG